MLEILLGQVPEAIYFAMFMILTKQIKEKRILFVILMTLEYIGLLQAFPYSVVPRILFFVLTFIILKLLYKEKVQITDVFTLGIASISLIIFNVCFSPLFYVNYILAVVLIRICMFVFLFIFRNKLNKIQKLYKKLWNRNDKEPRKIKSLTFRSLNLVIFNIMFYIINAGIIFELYKMYVKL